MTAPDLIGLFIEPLERTGIRYMITGGVASVIYGDPRFTRDIDVVLELQGRDVPALAAVFQGDEFYVPPVEALEEEAARPQSGHFRVIHPKWNTSSSASSSTTVTPGRTGTFGTSR